MPSARPLTTGQLFQPEQYRNVQPCKTIIQSSTGSDHGHNSALTDPIKDLHSPLLMESQRGLFSLFNACGQSSFRGGQNIARELELRTDALLLPEKLNLVEERIKPGQHLSQTLPETGLALIQANTMLISSGLKRRHP